MLLSFSEVGWTPSRLLYRDEVCQCILERVVMVMDRASSKKHHLRVYKMTLVESRNVPRVPQPWSPIQSPSVFLSHVGIAFIF